MRNKRVGIGVIHEKRGFMNFSFFFPFSELKLQKREKK